MIRILKWTLIILFITPILSYAAWKLVVKQYPPINWNNIYPKSELIKSSLKCAIPDIEQASAKQTATTIALIQYDAEDHFGNTTENLEALTQLALQAVSEGAKIIVLPEGGIHGYGDNYRKRWCLPENAEGNCLDVSKVAEDARDGISFSHWSDFSMNNDVIVLYNIIESDAGKFYNSLIALESEQVIALHRKVHLMDIEKTYATAGSTPTILKTPYGSFGLMICNDTFIGDALYANYRQNEVDGIIVSTYWTGYKPERKDFHSNWHFSLKSLINQTDLFVSDNSYSGGTGYYQSCRLGPEQNVLNKDINGVETFALSY